MVRCQSVAEGFAIQGILSQLRRCRSVHMDRFRSMTARPGTETIDPWLGLLESRALDQTRLPIEEYPRQSAEI